MHMNTPSVYVRGLPFMVIHGSPCMHTIATSGQPLMSKHNLWVQRLCAGANSSNGTVGEGLIG